MLKKTLRNQKGFTLIEIIAVLVILGILAAIAVPKYMNLQGEARTKAAQGAIAALQSTATMSYARALLAEPPTATANTWTSVPSGDQNVGDYWGTIGLAGNIVTVTVTGPSTLIVDVTNLSKTFQLW